MLYSMSCDPETDSHPIGTGEAPVFAAEFCRQPGYEHIVAVSDEEGLVTVLDTNRSRQSQAAEGRRDWRAHYNAIFALAWVPGQQRLLTASGDQTCRLFDVQTQMELRSFHGHRGSVKAVASLDAHVFASGARDGTVCIWDARLTQDRPVTMLADVHAPPAGAALKRRRSGHPTPASVSSILFLGTDVASAKLVSAGATDGAIKLWDMRALATSGGGGGGGGSGGGGGRGRGSRGGRGKAEAGGSSVGPSSSSSSLHTSSSASCRGAPSPLVTLHPPCCSHARARGIVSLSADITGTRLLAASTNSKIYVYDTRWHVKSTRHSTGGSLEEHVLSFGGHAVDSFYVKTTFSPDGHFIASGSSDGGLYVWEVARPELAPFVYWGHKSEVTAVAWRPDDWSTLVSASDDMSARVWRVDRKRGPLLNADAPYPSSKGPSGRPMLDLTLSPCGDETVAADEVTEGSDGAGRRESLPPFTPPFTPQTLPQPLLQPPANMETLGPPLPPPSLFSPLPALEGTDDAQSAAVGTDDAAHGTWAAVAGAQDGAPIASPAAAVAPARNTLRGWLLSATSPPGGPSSGR